MEPFLEQKPEVLKLRLDSVQFSHFSALDSFGRVFFWEDRVFRLVNPSSIPLCLEWFNLGLIDRLHKEDLIPATKIQSTVVIEGFPEHLILEHEKLIQSFIGEWTFSMIKKAASTLLCLNNILNEFGYELKDAHPYNMLFRGTQPLWIDLGSIQKKKGNNWIALNEFISSFYIPLKLWEKGEVYFVNKILNDKWFPHHRFLPHQNLKEAEVAKDIRYDILIQNIHFHTRELTFTICRNFKYSSFFLRLANFIGQKLTKRGGSPIVVKSRLRPLSEALTQISVIKKPAIRSAWNDYHEKYYSESLTPRIEKIVEKVVEFHSSSVLDLAGNQGLISALIYEKSKAPKPRVITTDYDENALDFGYNKVSERNTAINFALINCILSGQRDNTVYERYASDIVLALAITHHLILGQGYTLEYILETIRKYTKKYLFIEFMPLGLWSKGNPIPKLPEWYNIAWFREAVSRRFIIVSEDRLEENRVLFIASIK